MLSDTLYIVTDQGPAKGIGIYADALAKLLHNAFSDVRLLSLCYLPVEPRPGWMRLRGSRVAKSSLQVPSVMQHNYQLMREAVSPHSAVHFCGTSYRLVPHYPRSVVTIHDFYPRLADIRNLRDPTILLRDASSLWQFITLPRHVRTARERVVPTKFVQDCLTKRSSLSSTVVPHWIEPNRFRPRDQRSAREAVGLPQDEVLVLNVSEGTSNKNYSTLADIMGHLRKGFRMVKVGGRLPDSPGVIHVPRLSHDLYPLLFNACDVYLHASTQEGFGRPLIEAMASELPVVSLRTAVSLEVLGDAGIYVAPSSPIEEWVAAIERLTMPSDRIRIQECERRRASQFDPVVAREAYIRIYRSAFGM
jgi:glycosyltransferase involved in cell wall biosynthesis